MTQVYISDIVEYRLAHESLVKEISSTQDIFFSTNITKKIFEDHLNNQHTVIIFGDLQPSSVVKFHTIDRDINLFLNDDKLSYMLKSIDYLQKHNGVLIFLDNTNEKNHNMKDFGIGAQILKQLGITQIELISYGAKHSFIGLNGFGLTIKQEINIA
jgi:3,4-dihydroxy 2-butanone 4-phosphate synthase/GTP cyclohydrolase II